MIKQRRKDTRHAGRSDFSSWWGALTMVVVLLAGAFGDARTHPAWAGDPCADCISKEVEEVEKFLPFVYEKVFSDGNYNADTEPELFEKMAEQFIEVALHQLPYIGAFFDGKQVMESELLMRELRARAQKDYQPSTAMCTMGTNARYYAPIERDMVLASSILNRQTLERQVGATNANSAEGQKEDLEGRFETFQKRFCNPQDHDGMFKEVCTADAKKNAWNRDIDYGHTVDRFKTMNADYDAGGDGLLDEYAVSALASNLYGHRVLPRVPGFLIRDEDKQPYYMAMRALMAKRNVAAYSFNSIAAMKMKMDHADGLPLDYLRNVMERLGGDITQGDTPRMSYFEQMEYVTKRLYQDPSFFTSLYDTPANIDRQFVSMQAIGLMQGYDTLQSYLRTEMMLSLLVEMEIEKLQREVQESL